LTVSRKRLVQFAAALMIAFTLAALYFSVNDAYDMSTNYQLNAPIEQATDYVAGMLKPGENVIVLNPFNVLNANVVWFYLNRQGTSSVQVYPYPKDTVDTYTPVYNMTQLINEATTYNVKYLIVDEYAQTYHYFGTNLTFSDFNATLMATGRFTYLPVSFWQEPGRIFILTFN
jgi:hypothetical protein